MTNPAPSVLYVEDEPFLGKTLQRLLSEAGFSASVALNGEEALERAKSETFNLILLDLLLPKVDGFDVLKRLKEDPKTKMIPVIVLSNLGTPEDMEKTKALGAKNHFVKVTMDPRKLVAYVKALLEGPKKVA